MATSQAAPAGDATAAPDGAPHRPAEAKAVLRHLGAITPALAAALGPEVEVVLHDLSRLPNSIVAVGGNLTGRTVGGPMTDLMLRRIREHRTDDILRYRVRHRDRTFQSSTIFLRDSEHRPYACLCLNTDISSMLNLHLALSGVLGEMAALGSSRGAIADGDAVAADEELAPNGPEAPGFDHGEVFARSVDELADAVVQQAVARLGIPIELMHKAHKLEVVRAADQSGLFMIRSAVDSIAATLGVSRYTIYNYLNELRSGDGGSDAQDGHPGAKD